MAAGCCGNPVIITTTSYSYHQLPGKDGRQDISIGHKKRFEAGGVNIW